MGDGEVMPRVLLLGLAVAFALGPTVAHAAEEVTVSDLIELSSDLAGKEVTVEGELIGDYGRRRDGSVWTQLNGDSYVNAPIVEGGPASGSNVGVGIRIPAEMAADLDSAGGYRVRGPVVRVTGIWKYHDPDRQGESYLEVRSLEVIESGRNLAEDPDWPVFITGLVLLAAAAAAWATRPQE
jgi:hypothetical protein